MRYSIYNVENNTAIAPRTDSKVEAFAIARVFSAGDENRRGIVIMVVDNVEYETTAFFKDGICFLEEGS